MKRLLPLFVILMLMVSIIPASAAPAAEPRYVPAGLDYIDAQVNVFMGHLATFQDAYLLEHAQYYQSLESHSSAPDTLTPPDGLEDHPTYQNDDLGVLWEAAALPYELAWSFSVGTYDGPDGMGYVLNVSTVLDGKTYSTSINVGPETYRNSEWHEVVPFTIGG
jgi:hypothetical protein